VLRTRVAALSAGLAAAFTATLVLAAPAQAAVHYVALGDSYSSGVGAGSYTAESGDCKRTLLAYPQLWANAHAPSSYRSVACSGAETSDVINTQVSALSSQTTLVSITVGGNDVGFSSVMTTCVLYGTATCVAAVDAAEEKARNELPGKLDATYDAVRAHAPSAHVVVLDYPVFYELDTYCVGLSDESRAKINEGINLVDDITAKAAAEHGFTFADVRPIFVGHEICSGDKWLHATNWANIEVSYHPNTDGQTLGYYPVFSRSAA